jgi:hypothetical protein
MNLNSILKTITENEEMLKTINNFELNDKNRKALKEAFSKLMELKRYYIKKANSEKN